MTKKFWKKAGIRALHTVAQAALSYIGTSVLFIRDVNWLNVASAAILAGIISILKSLAIGIPEVDE